MLSRYGHVPVLLYETVAAAIYSRSKLIVDCTLGVGGYTKALLDSIAPDGRVIGIDRDMSPKQELIDIQNKYTPDRFAVLHGEYGAMNRLIESNNVTRSWAKEGVDSVVIDIGKTESQLSKTERGFHFHANIRERMDLRFEDRNTVEVEKKVMDMINLLKERELISVFKEFIDHQMAKRFAFKLVVQRRRKAIKSRKRLMTLIYEAIPRDYSKEKKIEIMKSMSKALNQKVFNEAGVLYAGMDEAVQLLRPGGTLVVISYHSSDDRTVIDYMKKNKLLAPVSKTPMRPPKPEIKADYTYGFARLRVAFKLSHEQIQIPETIYRPLIKG